MHKILEAMSHRVDDEARDGDVAHFKALLRQGELITKLAVLDALALLDDLDGPRFRYATEFSLVRAQGVGAWSFELQRLMTGPAKTSFRHQSSPLVTEITQRFNNNADVWQAECLRLLNEAERSLGAADARARTEKTAVVAFFTRFTNIRNKYDHGSQRLSQVTRAAGHLSKALNLLLEKLQLLHVPWVMTTTTYAGTSRAYSLSDCALELPEHLPSHGIFLNIDSQLLPIHLVSALGIAEELYLANGQFNIKDATYEGLCYVSGTHTRVDGSMFVGEPESLADSESEGLQQLDVQGASWGNLPPAKSDYVPRVDIEAELLQELLNGEIDPIITLGGPGGIGKTSTALQVLHEIAESGEFDTILWFSARDVDLLDAEGAVPVKPKVLSFADAAKSFASLVAEMGYDVSEPEQAFARALRGSGDRILFVFDNFETILEPTTLFNTLKSHLRLPNKLLITTRFTDFKGQYPIDINGMALQEFQDLVSTTASRLNIVDIIAATPNYVSQLHRETFGHPYVVKIVLGEIARERRIGHVERILAKRDDILDALFQRSFERLSPAAQRTFLLLCSWRSVVPLVALDAVQRRSGNAENIDVEAAIEELAVSSVVEILRPPGREDPRWVNVPAAAFRFGAGRVRQHSYGAEVVADSQYLRLLGPLKTAAIDAEALDLTYFFARASDALIAGNLQQDQVMDMILHLARGVPGAWRVAARSLHGVDDRGALKVLAFGPTNLQNWHTTDLKLRYGILKALSNTMQVQCGFDLLSRYLFDKSFDDYNMLLCSMANDLRLSVKSLNRAQREQILLDLLQTPRKYQDALSETTCLALAGLAAQLGLSGEQAAWHDQAIHIRTRRYDRTSVLRYTSVHGSAG